MPLSTACVRCQKVGLVRTERELSGKTLTVLYYCGACHHQWEVVENAPRPVMAGVTVKPKKDRRKA